MGIKNWIFGKKIKYVLHSYYNDKEYKFSSDEELLSALESLEPNIQDLIVSKKGKIAMDITFSKSMFTNDSDRKNIMISFDNIEELIHSINDETNREIALKKASGANEIYYTFNTYSLIKIK